MRAIVRYTTATWGKNQAIRYAKGLQSCFQILADNPGIGRACGDISAALRRHEYGKHVVFYRVKAGGIRIVRVLHQRMLPARARFEQ
jgi:toxin ParE1/3/4